MSCEEDGIFLYDCRAGRRIQGPPLSGSTVNWFTDLAFSPDGRRLAAGNANGTVEVLDADSGRSLLSLPGKGYAAVQVAFTPDGNGLLAASTEAGIRLWDGTPLPAPRRPFGFQQVIVEALWPLLEDALYKQLSSPNLRPITKFLQKQFSSGW